jgi:hypothetical protein
MSPPAFNILPATVPPRPQGGAGVGPYTTLKDHSHVSEVFSPNTADTRVTNLILKWIKSVK